MRNAYVVFWLSLSFMAYAHSFNFVDAGTIYIYKNMAFLPFSILGFLIFIREQRVQKVFFSALILVSTFMLGFGVYSGDYLYGISFLAFLFGCYYLAKNHIFSSYTFPVAIAAGILLVLFLDIINGGEFVYTSWYGRPRLQLGFSHPKEIGNLIVILVLWGLIWGNIESKLMTLLFLLLAVVLLWFVDSRNALLTMLVFFGSYTLMKMIGRSGFLLFSVVSFFVSATFVNLYFEELSFLSSGRLAWWSDVLSGNGDPLYRTTSLQQMAPKFDNFWLEAYYVMPGYLSATSFACFIFVVSQVNVKTHRTIYALLLAQAFNSFWDSGFMSIGSILNIYIWGTIFEYGQKRKEIRSN